MNDTVKRLLMLGGFAIFLAVAGAYFEDDDFSGPRRGLPPEEGGSAWLKKAPAEAPTGEVPAAASMDLVVEASSNDGNDTIGTAFLVAPDVWVTAGHVMDHCKAAYVRIGPRWQLVREVGLHATADAAVFRTAAPYTPPVLGITDRLPVLGQDGFHVGFPQEVPSTVYTRFIGQARIRSDKRGRPLEQGMVWAEQDRQPFTEGALGGASGGPQVDRTGAVQGVTILHSERRARVTTTPARRVRELLPEAIPHVETGGASIDPTDFGKNGDQARGTSAVALVFCSASGRTRPKG